MKKEGGFMKDALVLIVITVIAGACLGGVYQLTKGPIEEAAMADKIEAYQEVLSDAVNFKADDYSSEIAKANDDAGDLGFGNVLVEDCVTGVDSSSSGIGYVVTTTSKDGFGGDVTITVGITNDGEVKGIAFLNLEETAGLGMNAQNESFYSQYANKKVDQFTVTKTGSTSDEEIDALSGATITSNAVTNAVNMALYFVNNCLD